MSITTVESLARDLHVLSVIKKVAGKHACVVLPMRVTWNTRFRVVYGKHYGRERRIALASFLRKNPKQERLTFLHEVAHAINLFQALDAKAMRRSHGWQWKKIAKALGHSGNRCYSVDVEGKKKNKPRRKGPRMKLTGTCMDCGHEYWGYRALNHKGAGYRCGECRGPLGIPEFADTYRYEESEHTGWYG